MWCVQVDKVLEEVRKLMLEQARNSDKPVSVKELGITNVREVRTRHHRHTHVLLGVEIGHNTQEASCTTQS